MNETNTWEWLRDVVLPLGFYSRVESPDTSPGIPDVHYQINPHHTGWIELKCNMLRAEIPFPDEDNGLHKSQKKWLKRYVELGGIAWIIAETPEGIFIIHASNADLFNGATHHELRALSVEVIERESPIVATEVLSHILRLM